MKNRITKIVAVLAVVGLMAAGSVAYAVDNPQSSQNPKRGTGQGLFGDLNMTPEQKEAYMALNSSAEFEKIQAISDQMKTKMQAFDVAITKPNATQMDMSGIIAEISTLQTQMLSVRVDRLLALKKILTPEQFAKVLEMEKPRAKQGA